MRLRDGLPSLRKTTLANVVFRSFDKAKDHLGARLVHFSVQSNHLHLLVEVTGKPALSRAMQGLAIRLARRVNARVRRRGNVFPDRYHARPLRTPREVRHALIYVLRNNVHHATVAGVPTRFDSLSSAPYFDGFTTRPFLPKNSFNPPEEPPVARAETWLLRFGWRRLGLIRRDEAPA